MAKTNQFGDKMKSLVASLEESAVVHKDTRHIDLTLPEDALPKGVTLDSITKTVEFINDLTIGTEAAVANISFNQYEDTKAESWDGRLALIPGLVISATSELKGELGEETFYGITETLVDHMFTQEQTEWHTQMQEANVARVTSLFDK